MPLARDATVCSARWMASANSACLPGWMRMSASSRIMVSSLCDSEAGEVFAPLEFVLVFRRVEARQLRLLDAREVVDEAGADGLAHRRVRAQRLDRFAHGRGRRGGRLR